MSRLQSFIKKTQRFRLSFKQALFVVLAFSLMVYISYFFASGIVRRHLTIETEGTLYHVETQIMSNLKEIETMLGIISENVREMLLRGATLSEAETYIKDVTRYSREEVRIPGLINVFAMFDIFDGAGYNPVYDEPGFEFRGGEDFDPTDHPWYRAALAARGAIAVTDVYVDAVTGDASITYARSIFNGVGERLATICIDVALNRIYRISFGAYDSIRNYWVLFDSNLNVIAHPSLEFLGKPAREVKIGIIDFLDDLERGVTITERGFKNYKGENSVITMRKLGNGWHLGVVTLVNIYYEDLLRMQWGFIGLGILLAAALSVILIMERLRREAHTANMAKSTFLANMSHEIRSPMNAIIGMTTIGKSADDISRIRHCLEKIEIASQHLLGVINDILDMSKIEANKFELSFIDFNFEKMIARVVSIIEVRAEEKKQNFSVHIDKSIPKILNGDDQRLAQVITNLLSNAVKFTPEEGNVNLDAAFITEEDGVCTIRITVKDSGIGITPDQQKMLFSSFQQAESDTSRKFGGTGLGLAISKNIVSMMGGHFHVESEIGKGSSFSFIFKAKRGELIETENGFDPKKIEGIFKGYKALAAEDMDINREVLEALLQPTLLEIDFAENGEEAVAKFEKSPDEYDLILMDIQMPEMDGYEATRKIRKFEAGKNIDKQIPIIAMTANVFREEIDKCLASGMNDHVGKPFVMDDFIGILRKYLHLILL